MKYLKTYNESITSDPYTFRQKDYQEEVREEIKDIMRDCEDIGLSLSVQYSGSISPKFPLIVRINAIDRSPGYVLFRDAKPSIEHLINYMKSIGYNDFLYCDSISEFNYLTYRSKPQVDNILPPDDESRAGYIGSAQIIFKNRKK